MPEKSLWTAVKSSIGQKPAPMLTTAIQARTRQFATELTSLRKTSSDDPHFHSVISELSREVGQLPSNVTEMAEWCNNFNRPMLQYIEAYTYYEENEDSRLQKAPFVYVNDLRDLLQAGESQLSMSLGVSALSAIANTARRMLTVQASRHNSNNVDFSQVHSFDTGKPVSAAFDTVDIMDRAIFDMDIESPGSKIFTTVVELILLHKHGRQSMAICQIKPDGQRVLLFPSFLGSEFEIEIIDEPASIVLTHAERTVYLTAAPYVITKWSSMLSNLFVQPESQEQTPFNGLGISLSGSSSSISSYCSANDYDGDADIEPEDSSSSVNEKAQTEYTALKCANMGLPLNLATDFANVLARVQPVNPALDRPTLAAPRPLTRSTKSTEHLLPNPTAPFSTKTGASTPSPVLSVSSTGSPKIISKSLSEAEERRKRIELKMQAREQEDQVSRYGGSSIDSPHSVMSKPGMAFSASFQTDASQSVPDLSRPREISYSALGSNNSHDSLPTMSMRSVGAPPSIPPPSFKENNLPRKPTVRVSTPKRIESFGPSEATDRKGSAQDLSVVPISPVIPPAGEPSKDAPAPFALARHITGEVAKAAQPAAAEQVSVAKAVSIENLSSKLKQVEITAPPRPAPAAPFSTASVRSFNDSEALPRPSPQIRRNVQSMYSPSLGTNTPDVPWSRMDDRKMKTLSTPDLTENTPPMMFYDDGVAAKSKSGTSKLQSFKNLFKRRKSKGSKDAKRAAFNELDENVMDNNVHANDSAIQEEDEEDVIDSTSLAACDVEEEIIIPDKAPVLTLSTSGLSLSSILNSTAENTEQQQQQQQKKIARPINMIYRSTSSQNDLDKVANGSKLPKSDSANSANSASSNGAATAVYADSNNRTVVSSSQFPSSHSIARTVRSARSLRSYTSVDSMTTANTSVGSTDAWNRFMAGVKTEASKELNRAEVSQRLDERPVRPISVVEEIKEPEPEPVQVRKREPELVIPLAAEVPTSSMDPGRTRDIDRTQPILRKIYEAKEEQLKNDSPAVTPLEVPKFFQSSNPPATYSPISGLPLSNPAARVSFANDHEITMFSGKMWASKWTVNRWVPLSQLELETEVKIVHSGARIVIHTGENGAHVMKFGRSTDIRRSGLNDVEVRFRKDVYMMRSRNASDVARFFAALEALKVDLNDNSPYSSRPGSTIESDSMTISSFSSSSDNDRRRTLTPPILGRGSRSGSPVSFMSARQTIYEE